MEELEEMRAQLALLKTKLDSESIVNDRLMREVTRQRVRRLNRNVWQEGIACLFVVTVGNYVFHHLGCSIWFMVATTLMMTICFLATIIPHSRVKMDEIMSGDLLTVAKQVRRLKQTYQDWIKYGLILITLWLGWFAYEIYLITSDWHLALPMIGACFIGGCIGGIIGYTMHRRLVREMDEIIASIEQ